jgi:hypothetical protein
MAADDEIRWATGLIRYKFQMPDVIICGHEITARSTLAG